MAYFHSRPRGSQIGAWASHQSQVIESRETLAATVKQLEQQYAGQEIPLPPFWGGFRVKPSHIELWQGRSDRLHDRYSFNASSTGWQRELLAP